MLLWESEIYPQTFAGSSLSSSKLVETSKSVLESCYHSGSTLAVHFSPFFEGRGRQRGCFPCLTRDGGGRFLSG